MSGGYPLKDVKNLKEVIDCLSKVYCENKLKSEQNYPGPYVKYENDKEYSENVIKTIESGVNCLNENDHFVIYNEVILGKKGDWYSQQISQSTYYRYRGDAYYNFLSCLQR